MAGCVRAAAAACTVSFGCVQNVACVDIKKQLGRQRSQSITSGGIHTASVNW